MEQGAGRPQRGKAVLGIEKIKMARNRAKDI